MDEYPEHNKLHSIKDISQQIGYFIDWMIYEKQWAICEFRTKIDSYEPIYLSIEKILAEYFEIDSNKLEAEKLLMLDKLRSSYE